MSIFCISGVCDRCVVRMHWKPGLYLIYPGFKAQTLIAKIRYNKLRKLKEAKE